MPRRIFVARHQGALDWAKRHVADVEVTARLDPETLSAGDVVMGVMSIPLAAALGDRGVNIECLVMDVPPEFRGCELSADEMERFKARLEAFHVRRLP